VAEALKAAATLVVAVGEAELLAPSVLEADKLVLLHH
jgi:type II secretory pathway predicted ATPase ExeA